VSGQFLFRSRSLLTELGLKSLDSVSYSVLMKSTVLETRRYSLPQ